MRILFTYIYHNVGFGMGGSTRGVYELCRGMQEKLGHEVLCITNAGHLTDALREANVRVVEIPRKRHQTFSMIQTIAKELKSFKPDIVHSNHRYMTFLLDVFFKGKHAPILHTERAQAWDKKWLYRYGDFATAVAPSLRDHLIAYYEVPEDKIRAITNAVDFKAPDPTKLEELRKKYPRKEGQVVAACIGRFEEQKGHCYLVDAVAKLSDEAKQKLQILLIGDGGDEAALRFQMERLGVAYCFQFLGYHSPVSEPLSLADFFILPSLWEGLPRSMIEAFFCGKPAIATDIPGNNDIVVDGVNGQLVPARDSQALAQAIEEWLANPDQMSKRAEAALETSKNHEIERVLVEYQALYEQLVSEFQPTRK